MINICHVCIPHTNHDYFDYVTSNVSPAIGTRIWVPFRKQERLGIVVGSSIISKLDRPLKSIHTIIDEQPILSAEILALCQWISTYYQAPLSEVLPLAIPKKLRQAGTVKAPLVESYLLTKTPDEAYSLLGKKALKQRALVDFLAQQKKAITKNELTRAGFTKAQLDKLNKLNIVHQEQLFDLPNLLCLKNEPLILNEEQAIAVSTIKKNLKSYHCFLLQGITGSGKTEVYLHVIAEVLARGQQVLILVPEIGLTPQLLKRFSARFDKQIVTLHSNLNESERYASWYAAMHNIAHLVIGTRAAIFTPMPKLGLIIIDEEHDSSLKQMDNVRYSARDTALIRAHQANIPIILGSATPSLESLHNCRQKKYTLLQLNHKALTSQPLNYQLIDLRSASIHHGLAERSVQIIAHHLNQGNQVLVFINRRGFAPILLCHACGFMIDCRACDSHLTLHRHSHRLICHHCGLSQAIPTKCEQCENPELIPIGTGTQRLYDYLATVFPDTKILRIDRDEIRKKNEFENRLELINNEQAQLLVGTQMLAKGHHFPKLTLVVVVDADFGFYNQDFRAIEQLGQLLTQVSGRAGRAENPGQVLIQTHIPHHPLLNILIQKGYAEFAKMLLASREQAALPPYHYLAVIRAQHKQNERIEHFLKSIKNYLSEQSLQILGPAPSPLARKANVFRMQLLIKSSSRKHLHLSLTAMREWIRITKQSQDIRWNIDVDPMDLS
ncbi:primosomal protein N' (replication factor Y) (superfamily II helicase) [Legionella busanensis]|uniref:Replication restart protein PriA n=1 Tax=Legionella busanensis TaxID=190655 RepID=A0A378JQ82_9GAMM|nr:primosomal protein N' [Legionella busanensis]STX52871.1 primosomal protein N' (replication factor Y) (superfamily II helicase) [Legionella busanensis]